MTFAERLKRATYLAALPAAAALTATVVPLSAAHAQAQAPAATMTVLTPKQNEALGTNRFNLDVRFKSITNSPIVTAELWVDGVRWVRQDLESPRRASTLSFAVDGSTLAAGSHTIVVKVLNAEGNISSAKVNVIAGSNEAAGENAWGGPEVQFVSVGNGKKVSGAVELLVDAKGKNGQNPYVTFYVDDKFKTLKNYPPYSFVWDTTTESNGVHTIVASGYLDSSNVTTTRKITVYVNNPGGFTKRVSEIPDLSAPKTAPVVKTPAKTLTIPMPKKAAATPAPVASDAPTGVAHLAETAAALPKMESLGIAAPVVSTAKIAVAPRLVTPKAPVFTAAPETAAPQIADNTAPAADQEPIVSVAKNTGTLEAGRALSKLTEITFDAPKASTMATPRPLRPETAVPATDTVVAQPIRTTSALPTAKTTQSIAAPVRTLIIKPTVGSMAAPAPKQLMPKQLTPAPVPTKSLIKTVRRTDSLKTIQVAYDGERIAFDVAPRVEAGLPIAPFRQIFEHSGGKVSWANDTKTMRAVNSNREIVIGVGKKSATVNGEKVSLDRAATLEKGRTIVPLNFVGKAMDVDVKYDPVTGRLSITSKN